ncbi:MAG: diaminopimelate decarboxylase [Halieaceae bacterium]|jgi:diaminopimelate decarboxylase|nr:diaminopimelate decarboxylase [Halieaceae bacterium]
MSTPFTLRNSVLHAESVSLKACAERFGTPLYVYSKAAISEAFNAYQTALGAREHLICYAVKANSNLAVLQLLAGLGAGFDIVSNGELQRVIAAGGDPGKVIFSGVGKRDAEMRQALRAGIRCFNVESAPELDCLSRVAAEEGRIAPVSIRVNPDVDAQTHPYISTGLKENKFGVDSSTALDMYRRAATDPHLQPVGIDCHIGSQITETAPFVEALDHLLELVDQLASEHIVLSHIDIGGGLGVTYRDEQLPATRDYIAALEQRLEGRPLELILEPGRSIVANAGVLVTEVLYLKPGSEHSFAIVDAAMNDLLRPSLYNAWQSIEPVTPRAGTPQNWDIVGPVCETGDFLGKQRPLCLEAGDLLAVGSAGAYGFTMASNYNTRVRPPEVMVDGTEAHLIREREELSALWAGEHLLGGAPS